ncbi:PMSR-domain-containing protein [Xylariaceae sp. FL0016]|nr:PMSR-domain-containing protein [Xylariaceae sp. FL0016]
MPASPLNTDLALPILTLALALALTMAFTTSSLPPFLSRLLRPLTTSARLSVSPDGAGSVRPSLPEGAETATVAAGCFWGVEHLYRKHFAGKGLYDARVGYIGGDASNPTYRMVCTGRTGHTEALQIHFDPKQLTYAQLLEFFYRMHDPTTANRQGPDVGTQYRSGIYYHTPEQQQVAQDITKKAGEQWYQDKGKIATEVLPAGTWWDAEDYHQLYLDKNPGGYECPSHFLRSFPPLH